MTPGKPLQVIRDLTNLFEAKGILLPDGNFDAAKLDTIQEDIEFAMAVEGVLKHHGLEVPAKVDKIIAILPLLAAIVQ